jgi:hypothetical protein
MQTGPIDAPLRPWRVAVFGGTALSDDVAAFTKAVGQRLGREADLVLITGGFQCWNDDPKPSVDWFVAEAFAAAVTERLKDRIETYLPDETHDGRNITRFEMGRVRRLDGQGRQRRRFTMVNRADALIGLAGDDATNEMISLAMAIGKPCLPLAFTEGAAKQRWKADKQTVCEQFRLSSEEIAWLDGPMPAEAEFPLSADRSLSILRRVLGRKCFVVTAYRDESNTQYRQAVKPALLESGFIPVRADEIAQPGDAVLGLRAAVQASDLVVALLDEPTLNVLYEIGYAQALGKQVIFIATRPPEALQLPFDIRNEQMCGVRCGSDNAALREELKRFIRPRGEG